MRRGKFYRLEEGFFRMNWQIVVNRFVPTHPISYLDDK